MNIRAKMIRPVCAVGLLALAFLACPRTAAKPVDRLGPVFTPVHLVKDANLIVVLDLHLGKDDKTGKVEAVVKRVMLDAATRPSADRGNGPATRPAQPFTAKAIIVDLNTSPKKEEREALEKTLKAVPATPALFFAGQGMDDEGNAASRACLFVNDQWFWLVENKDQKGVWDLEAITWDMGDIWRGGTDMFIRCLDYVLPDPDHAYVPVTERVNWEEPRQLATIKGKVHAAMPIDLAGDGKLLLFIASEGGDKLFRYEAQKDDLKDVTDTYKLASKSIAAAWGDFNGDGRIDLASYDGQAITIYNQTAEGTFVADAKLPKADLSGACVGLAALDCDGKAGLLISTTAWPVLWVPQDKEAKPLALTGDAAALKDLGTTYACVVADLDGDGWPDILLPCAKGSLIFKGQKPGAKDALTLPSPKLPPAGLAAGEGIIPGAEQFAAPVPRAIAVGGGPGSAFVGDFDADGLLDVFTLSDEASHLYQNSGKCNFVDALWWSGEVAYKANPGGIGGITCDFNNDGRQDLVLFYPKDFPIQFFNRGFRSFRVAENMDLSESQILPAAGKGQQAGTVADFSGNGAQDLVLILNNGEAWVFYRKVTEEEPVYSVRAALPAKASYHGPLLVTGWNEGRCLGAWNVTPGTGEAFFGVTTPGDVTLKWQIPGHKPTVKTVPVKGPMYVTLGP